ncbi:MAG: sigma-70 family RNA polymerase sigma factor [Planctomycetaceae bacterium]|nr:sigma-70 family RNA polymerase sigma factor [Planctomycetaceae bacterium]
MTKYGFPPEDMVKVIDAHFASLVLFARQWDGTSAEDIVQNAFLKLLKHSTKKGQPEQVLPWLFQVVRNEAVSRYRKNARREKHEQQYAAERSQWFDSDDGKTLESAELVAVLKTLPLEQREIVVMRIWGGLSFDEIAKLTGDSRTTVFRKYNDTLDELRKKY